MLYYFLLACIFLSTRSLILYKPGIIMDEVSSSCMLYPSATPPQPNGSTPVGGNASDVDDLSCQNAI